MGLRLEQLEDRNTPVTFSFHFDATVPESFKAPVEQAGAFVGSHLGRQDVIDVPVTHVSLGNDVLARGGPGVGILIGTEHPFYTGADTSGLRYDQFDLFTVMSHELGHVLGQHEHLPAGAVMGPYVEPGKRAYYTLADWRAIDSHGWQVEDRLLHPRDLFFVSLLGADGWCRQYVVGSAGAFQVGAFYGYHVTLEDVNEDGILDWRFTPATLLPQTSGAVSGKDYSLLDGPHLTIGTAFVVNRI